MNRIDKKFKELKKRKKKALIIFLTAGDFGLSTTKKLVLEIAKSGADIIELGIPFSDPIADGPTIQASSERSLKLGVKLVNVIRMVKDLRGATNIPIVLMTYYNPLLRYGLERFVIDCADSGIDGVIIPDLPPEEADELMAAAKRKNFCAIFLLSPTSSAQRIKLISNKSRGFIYYVSLTGITGVRAGLPEEVSHRVNLIKRYTKKPVCVGFGVSNPKQVRQIVRVADGVIVGSAVVKLIARYGKDKRLFNVVGKFVKRLTFACEAGKEA